MSITFDYTPIEWKNKGVEPPETLKESGFMAGYKPPASYFNAQWSRVSDCLKELQVKLSDYATLNDQEKEDLSAEIATKLDSSEFTAERIIEVLNAASGSSGSGLNADTLDGKDSSAFLDASEFTAKRIIEILNTASGSSGGGLNADTLDGKDSSAFSAAGHTHAQSEIPGLTSALAGKAATSHTHEEFEDMVSVARSEETPSTAPLVDSNLLGGHPASYFATSEHTHTSYYSSTLTSSGWSVSTPYTQTVSITGILASDNPIVDVVLSATTSTAQSQLSDWWKVNRIVTSNGKITAYCYGEAPTVNLPISLMCVR